MSQVFAEIVCIVDFRLILTLKNHENLLPRAKLFGVLYVISNFDDKTLGVKYKNVHWRGVLDVFVHYLYKLDERLRDLASLWFMFCKSCAVLLFIVEYI